MGQQINKHQKRLRRKRYIKRLQGRKKTPAAAKK